MTGDIHGLHMALAPSTPRRPLLQMGMAMVLLAILHFYFESLLALSGRLLPLILGEALVITACLLLKDKRALGIVLSVAAALTLAALFLMPEARDGARRLINQLFTASEARNRYVYTPLPISAETLHGEALFRMGLGIMGAIASILLTDPKCKAGVLVLAALIAFIEVYFGIVPNAVLQLILFLFLAGLLLRRNGTASSLKRDAWLLAPVLVMALLVSLFCPGVDAGLESRSEQWRDWLSQTLESSAANGLDSDAAINLTRQEGLLAEAEAHGRTEEEQAALSYERSLAYQQDISNPRSLDYIRIALLFLAIVALLLIPFLPFLWLDRQKRRAAAMRADFDAPDCAQAIIAIFRHAVRCLTVFGLPDDNRSFAQLLPADDPRISDGYRSNYQCAALLWQEAAYSDHPMTAVQRETVLSLLKETEQLVYQLADRKMRFRLKYIACLILQEDAA